MVTKEQGLGQYLFILNLEVIYKELAETYPLCFDVATEQRERLIPWLAEHFAGFDYGICWRAEQAYQQDLALDQSA